MPIVTDKELKTKQLTDLINRRFDEVNNRLNDTDKQLSKLNENVTDIKIKLADIDSKIQGLDARVQNQEWMNRTLFVGIVVGFLVGLIKLLFFPNPV